ncbi:MAG: glycosyltransferase [Candidatus Acidiferrales bacterium]
MNSRALTFAVATNRREILDRNLLASPIFRDEHPHQILVQENYPSAAAAYNDAIERSENDLMVFLHQDMYLPESWMADLQAALQKLKADDPHWGVLGCSGRTDENEGRGYVYSHGYGFVGEPFERLERVQTLDEIVLIFRKSSGLRFDPAFPSFHMYGSDICLTAASRGMNCYAIPAFCIHNTQWGPVLPPEFYECYRILKRKWRDQLPIYTTCIEVTRFNAPMYERRLREVVRPWMGRARSASPRMKDTQKLIEMVDGLKQQLSASR